MSTLADSEKETDGSTGLNAHSLPLPTLTTTSAGAFGFVWGYDSSALAIGLGLATALVCVWTCQVCGALPVFVYVHFSRH